MTTYYLGATPISQSGKRWPHNWGSDRFGGQGALALQEAVSDDLGTPVRFIWRNGDRKLDSVDFRVDWAQLFHPHAARVLFLIWYLGDKRCSSLTLPADYVDSYILKRLPHWNVRPSKDKTE